MTTAITNFLGLTHTDASVRACQDLVREVEQALTAQTITTEEYVSLMIELERLEHIIQISGQIELTTAVHEALLGLIALAKTAKVL
jgi:hypothetical protein